MKNNDLSLIKAVLRRHVIEFIFEHADKYFLRNDNSNNSDVFQLESRIYREAHLLVNLMDKFVHTRHVTDNVTSSIPIKMRQQVFSTLSNHGFSDIIINHKKVMEHSFINQLKMKLNKEMESYRKILQPKKKQDIEEKASDIIRRVVKLFFFQHNTQEPIAKFKWFNSNDKIDSTQMTGSWDEKEIEDSIVELCAFPLIYKESNSSSSKLQIYTPAEVFIRKNHATCFI